MRLLRPIFFTSLLVFCALAWAGPVRADTYPSRPITIVVPYTPGGTVDLLARALGQRLTALWGQQVIVDDRPGAGGSVGAAFVAKAPADGYTLLLCTNAPLTTNLLLYPEIGYDPLRDFTPIIVAGSSGSLIAVNPNVKATTVAQLVALAKAQPGVLAAATSGNGSTADLTVAEFNRAAHTNIRTVPYRGGVPSLAAAMSGEVPIVFSDLVPAMEYLRAGKLRAIATTGLHRSILAPQIPTLAESGYPTFNVASWVGLVAPKATPPAIIQKLYKQIDSTLRSPEFHHDAVMINLSLANYTPAQFEAFLRTEIPRWQTMVKESNLKVQ